MTKKTFARFNKKMKKQGEKGQLTIRQMMSRIKGRNANPEEDYDKKEEDSSLSRPSATDDVPFLSPSIELRDW